MLVDLIFDPQGGPIDDGLFARDRTSESPFTKAFFTLLEALDVVPTAAR